MSSVADAAPIKPSTLKRWSPQANEVQNIETSYSLATYSDEATTQTAEPIKSEAEVVSDYLSMFLSDAAGKPSTIKRWSPSGATAAPAAVSMDAPTPDMVKASTIKRWSPSGAAAAAPAAAAPAAAAPAAAAPAMAASTASSSEFATVKTSALKSTLKKNWAVTGATAEASVMAAPAPVTSDISSEFATTKASALKSTLKNNWAVTGEKLASDEPAAAEAPVSVAPVEASPALAPVWSAEAFMQGDSTNTVPTQSVTVATARVLPTQPMTVPTARVLTRLFDFFVGHERHEPAVADQKNWEVTGEKPAYDEPAAGAPAAPVASDVSSDLATVTASSLKSTLKKNWAVAGAKPTYDEPAAAEASVSVAPVEASPALAPVWSAEAFMQGDSFDMISTQSVMATARVLPTQPLTVPTARVLTRLFDFFVGHEPAVVDQKNWAVTGEKPAYDEPAAAEAPAPAMAASNVLAAAAAPVEASSPVWSPDAFMQGSRSTEPVTQGDSSRWSADAFMQETASATTEGILSM